MEDQHEAERWRFRFQHDEDPQLVAYASKGLDRYHDRLFLLCFGGCWGPEMPGRSARAGHRGYDTPELWRDYGADGRGVALVFDRYEFDSEIEPLVLPGNPNMQSGPVRYLPGGFPASPASTIPRLGTRDFKEALRAARSSGDMKEAMECRLTACRYLQLPYSPIPADDALIEMCAIREVMTQVQQQRHAVLLMKDTHWEHEHEYRFVFAHLRSEPIPDYVEARFGSSLHGIVLGDKVDGAVLYEIERFCERNRVGLMRIDWSRGRHNPVVVPEERFREAA
jgi:hypothetical protein